MGAVPEQNPFELPSTFLPSNYSYHRDIWPFVLRYASSAVLASDPIIKPPFVCQTNLGYLPTSQKLSQQHPPTFRKHALHRSHRRCCYSRPPRCHGRVVLQSIRLQAVRDQGQHVCPYSHLPLRSIFYYLLNISLSYKRAYNAVKGIPLRVTTATTTTATSASSSGVGPPPKTRTATFPVLPSAKSPSTIS